MSDTPRTDAEFEYTVYGASDIHAAVYEMTAFSRQLERELNAANERIKRLEEAGDAMYEELNPPSPSMRTTAMDNALQGWDDAKIKI